MGNEQVLTPKAPKILCDFWSMVIILLGVSADQYLSSIGEAMSNSFPQRRKTTVLEAFETLFNKGDYAGGRRLGADVQHTHTSGSRWSTMRFAAALLVAL